MTTIAAEELLAPGVGLGAVHEEILRKLQDRQNRHEQDGVADDADDHGPRGLPGLEDQRDDPRLEPPQ
jgi:hypothetical protein